MLHTDEQEAGDVPEVEFGDQQLWYEVHGEGDPIVTLTNVAAPYEVWPGPYVRKMTEAGYQVVAFQHLGPSADRERIVADFGALIEHLQLGRVHLWGYSQGGIWAQELALARPDLVRSAVLMATVARKRAFDRVVENFYDKLDEIRDTAPEVAQAGETLWGFMSFGPSTLANDTVVEMVLSFMTDRSSYPEEAMKRSRAMWRAWDDPRERLAGVRVPCLAIGFEIDLICLAAGVREVADAIPGATYVEIAGASHSGIATHTDEIFEHVLKFFANA